MGKQYLFGLVFFFVCLYGYGQVEKVKIGKTYYANPSTKTLGYLMTHIDSLVWNNALLPLGYIAPPLAQRQSALEYRKSGEGRSYYIGFDSHYWVITIIWTDETNKYSLADNLKKSLKGREMPAKGNYKINYSGTDLIIGIGSEKNTKIYETITVEIERK